MINEKDCKVIFQFNKKNILFSIKLTCQSKKNITTKIMRVLVEQGKPHEAISNQAKSKERRRIEFGY